MSHPCDKDAKGGKLTALATAKHCDTRLWVLTLVIAAVGGLCAGPARAVAQGAEPAPAIDLSEIRFRLRRGETVFVTSTGGLELRAELEAVVVERNVLLVDVDGVSLALPAGGVRTIHRQRRDSLKNGALIGAAHGLATALLLTAITSDDTNARELLGFSWILVPAGAGVGAAIDHAHKSRELVYRGGGGLFPAIDPLPRPRMPKLGFSIRLVW